ncbi:MAG: hypothetical protein R3D55_03520 [Chloroflexota bacterium]
MGVDLEFFAQMSGEVRRRLRQPGRPDIAGEPFSINSTQQMSDILFKKLGYRWRVKENEAVATLRRQRCWKV